MRAIGFVLGLLLGKLANAQVFEVFPITGIDEDSTDSRAVVLFDLDEDGCLDILFTNSSHEDARLFLGTSTGGWLRSFAGDLTDSGGRSDGASFADIDGDGDLDGVIVNWYGEPNQLFRNDGGASFTRLTGDPVSAPGSYSETCSWADVDGNGWLDLYVTNSGGTLQNGLFINQSNGEVGFQQNTLSELVQWGGHSRAAAFSDWDLDGQQDLVVTNEGEDPNHVFRNDPQSGWTLDFTNPLFSQGMNTMTASWGDVDNDGDPDLFLGNHGHEDRIYRVTPGGVFVRDTLSVFPDGTRTFGSAFGDLDNDCDLDLLVTQGWGPDPAGYSNLLYRNDGTGHFQPWPDSLLDSDPGWGYGCALGDLDQDGHLDAVIARWFGEHQPNRVLRNRSTGGNWVQFELEGSSPNTTAIGARVVCRTTSAGENVIQSRWVEGQSGYCGQSLRQFFGIGDGTSIDQLEVHWPDGAQDSWQDLAPNRVYRLHRGGAHEEVGIREPSAPGFKLELGPAFPNPSNGSTRIEWHQGTPGHIRLTLHDIQGRRVLGLAEGDFAAGQHGIRLDPSGLPSGIYLLHLVGAGGVASGKLLLMK